MWDLAHATESEAILPFFVEVTSDLDGALADCPFGTVTVLTLALRPLAALEGADAALETIKYLQSTLPDLPATDNTRWSQRWITVVAEVTRFAYEQILERKEIDADEALAMSADVTVAVPLTTLSRYQWRLFNAHVDTFRSTLPPITDLAILPSEGLAFTAFADLHDVDVIIESGVWKGFSTEIWARTGREVLAMDLNVQSEARSRLSKYKNVEVIQGDGSVMIPQALERSNRSTAVFIDGPKGEFALRLAERVLKRPNVKFVALHDMRPWKATLRSGQLQMQCFFITDEEWFLRDFGWLDEGGGNGGPMAFVERS